jgi:hypothetical protein
MDVSTKWLRDRARRFRERAEQANDDNTKVRLLQAAAAYEQQAGAEVMAQSEPLPALPQLPAGPKTGRSRKVRPLQIEK